MVGGQAWDMSKLSVWNVAEFNYELCLLIQMAKCQLGLGSVHMQLEIK